MEDCIFEVAYPRAGLFRYPYSPDSRQETVETWQLHEPGDLMPSTRYQISTKYGRGAPISEVQHCEGPFC